MKKHIFDSLITSLDNSFLGKGVNVDLDTYYYEKDDRGFSLSYGEDMIFVQYINDGLVVASAQSDDIYDTLKFAVNGTIFINQNT